MAVASLITEINRSRNTKKWKCVKKEIIVMEKKEYGRECYNEINPKILKSLKELKHGFTNIKDWDF